MSENSNDNGRFNGFIDNNLFIIENDELQVDDQQQDELSGESEEDDNEQESDDSQIENDSETCELKEAVEGEGEVIFEDYRAVEEQLSVKEIEEIEFDSVHDEKNAEIIFDEDNLKTENQAIKTEKQALKIEKEDYKMATFKKDQYSSMVGEVADNTIKLKQTVKEVEYNKIDNIANLDNGEILKQARQMCGYDFAEVEEITKIKKSYIIALEEDDFSNMPPFVYTSAYVRTLCEVYRLAPEHAEQIIDRIKLDRSVQISERMDHGSETDSEQEKLDEQDKKVILWFSVVGIMILSLIALGTVFIIQAFSGKNSKVITTTVNNAIPATTTIAATAVKTVNNGKFNREKFSKLLPPVQLKEDELPMEK